MQGPKWPLFTLIWTLCGRWMCWDRLCTKGRAPRTKETLPDFRERCRVCYDVAFPRCSVAVLRCDVDTVHSEHVTPQLPGVR